MATTVAFHPFVKRLTHATNKIKRASLYYGNVHEAVQEKGLRHASSVCAFAVRDACVPKYTRSWSGSPPRPFQDVAATRSNNFIELSRDGRTGIAYY